MRASSLATRPPPNRPVAPSSPRPASSCIAFLRAPTATNLSRPPGSRRLRAPLSWSSVTTAAALVEEIRTELASARDQLLAHPYVAAVEAGMVDLSQLRPFAGEQHAIISSDLRSVAHLVSRFGCPFFLDVLAGERAALEALPPLA